MTDIGTMITCKGSGVQQVSTSGKLKAHLGTNYRIDLCCDVMRR
jgi:hypothetical protein